MINRQLHDKFCQSNNKLYQWYCEKTKEVNIPFYSSYDIRDSGFKVANVDANIYPAGFNNICQVDQENDGELMRSYFKGHYGSQVKKVFLVTEEHTQNPFYWDNVKTISRLLESSGLEVRIGFPRALAQPLELNDSHENKIKIFSADPRANDFIDFKPDLIISNNDFSQPFEDWARSIKIPINPPRELGWYQRKKSTYFRHFNQIVEEFSQLIGQDPFLMNVETIKFDHFDLSNDEAMKELAEIVDGFLGKLKNQYSKREITTEPFVFVKNNSGTYGLGVTKVSSGKEILDWNYKARKKMKAAKGGREIQEVIIQEGIPSRIRSDGASAEPVIYMIGCDLAGGFLRTHADKSATESLNSPGAVYKRLCVSDLNVSIEGHPLENVYGWSARLGLLAIALEAVEMKVEFQNFIKKPCV